MWTRFRIKVGRRELNADYVRELAASIKELGLLNPLTVDKENVLIAGLHRLEAVKLLEWPEVECTVSSLEGLRAELAEIDKNIVRNDFSAIEYGEMLLRRKEIYETLHPETKKGGGRKSEEIRTSKCRSDSVTTAFAKILLTSSTVLEDDTEPKVPLTPAQEIEFLLFAQNNKTYQKYYDELIILLETRLRISELCKLTETDLDFENRFVNIDHQLLRSAELGYYIGTPKTDCRRYQPTMTPCSVALRKSTSSDTEKAGKARSYGLYRHLKSYKEIIKNRLRFSHKKDIHISHSLGKR